VELIQVGQASAGVAIALSVVSLLFTWLLLLAISFLGGRRGGTVVV
jgi:putative spermidine/putrescine transport system permease protein